MKAILTFVLLVGAAVAYYCSLLWVSGTASTASAGRLLGGAVAWGLVAGVVLAWLLSIVWAFRDARGRGKSGLLVALMVAVLPWPAGLIAWLVFRPSRLRSA